MKVIMIRKKAIFGFITLISFLLLITGCATKRDVMRIDDKVTKIYTDQQQMQMKIERLDSLLYSEGEESIKLRAEIRSSISDLLDEFRIMQSNLSDLQAKVAVIAESGSGSSLAPVTFADTTGDSAATQIPGIDCQKLYDESFINVRRGEYEEAVQGFTDYLTYCSSRDLADNSRFWIGESYYSMERYPLAIEEFQKLLDDYPESEKRAGALYKMGRSYEELGRKGDARATFQKLADDFPGTLEAEQAKEKLRELE